LKSVGLDFEKLHREGIDAVVSRIEIDYRQALKSGNVFKVISSAKPKGVMRFIFEQKILRLPDLTLTASAIVYTAFMKNGTPIRTPEKMLSAFRYGLHSSGECAMSPSQE
jgi:acyl-CoA thioester hydrolase